MARGLDGKVKPVLMLSVDGGPDENPRYKKVISHCITHFSENDLDGLFVFTNAPGRSAYNRVERRMAPLSRELASVVLPHDHYGSHLDSSGNTTDLDLEIKNFQHAGETLAEIWRNVVIDGFEVVTEYVPPGEELPTPEEMPDLWYATHVRESQYLLQIVKCDDVACCKPRRSNLRNVLFQNFLPAPYVLTQQPFCIPSNNEATAEDKFPPLLVRQTLTLRPNYPQWKEIPYDMYCPTVKDTVPERVCLSCGVYFASKESLKTHRRNVHGRQEDVSRVRPLRVLSRRPGEALVLLPDEVVEWVDVETVEENEPTESAVPPELPVITNMDDWLNRGTPFVNDV